MPVLALTIVDAAILSLAITMLHVRAMASACAMSNLPYKREELKCKVCLRKDIAQK